MKDFAAAVLIVAVLSGIFSFGSFPAEAMESRKGTWPKHPGELGAVIPEDGNAVPDAMVVSEAEPDVKSTETERTSGETPDVPQNPETFEETKKEERKGMAEVLTAFWHGVASVLIGETAALMVAIAWLKIRRHYDNT